MAKIRKEFLHIISSFAIIIAVLLLGIVAMVSIIVTGLSHSHNSNTLFSSVRNAWCTQKIESRTFSKNDKIVVLRLDDVQAFAWSEIAMKMIRDAYKYDAPIVAWIIPKTLPEDRELTNFLKREHCNIEVALHGWDHSWKASKLPWVEFETEFWNISYKDAKERIGSGIDLLKKYNNGKAPHTFVPPYNLISTWAIRAARELWIKVISSIGTGTYDYHTTTYNFDKRRIVPVAAILDDCNIIFETNPICVIMMHPQDYSKDENKLDEWLYRNYYVHLLEELQKNNIQFATFEELKSANF